MGRELQKIWNVTVKIIPLVVGSLVVIPKQIGNRLKHIGITVGRAQVQITVLLGTARILRKATGCGWISTVFSSILLLCVSSITITIIIIIIIIIIMVPGFRMALKGLN